MWLNLTLLQQRHNEREEKKGVAKTLQLFNMHTYTK